MPRVWANQAVKAMDTVPWKSDMVVCKKDICKKDICKRDICKVDHGESHTYILATSLR